MPLVLGLVAALGHAPFYAWYLALPAFSGLFFAVRDRRSPRQAAIFGWLAGLGYIGLTHHWIVSPFFVDAARDGWMAPFALFFMVAGIALFWAAAFGAAAWLSKGQRSIIPALVLTWSLAELSRAYLLTGFPWALPSMIWVDLPIAQVAYVVGPHGLTFLTLLAAALPALWRRSPQNIASTLVAVALLAGLYSFGAARLHGKTLLTGHVVRVVQPNAAQHMKWQRDMVPVFLSRLLKLTAEPGPGQPPDVVVWPETAIAYGLENSGAVLERAALMSGGVPVISGIQRRDGQRYFNSLVVVDDTGAVAALYDKSHLVPFGEYVPFGDVLGRFGFSSFAAQAGNGYSAGQGSGLLDLGKMGHALALICYEAIFPQLARGGVPRPDWILHATNDAWFGAFMMPHQHFDQARMRAIEQGLPVVRAANTGVSGVIDPFGRTLAALPMNTPGFADAPLAAPLQPGLYAKTGDTPLIAILIVAGALLGMRRFIKRP